MEKFNSEDAWKESTGTHIRIYYTDQWPKWKPVARKGKKKGKRLKCWSRIVSKPKLRKSK